MAISASPTNLNELTGLAAARPGAGWRWASRLLAVSVLIPLAVIVGSWLVFDPEVWRHLSATVLPELLTNTGLLVLGVGIGTMLLGVSLAWLTSVCEFPGRRWLDWGLMLPFAVPTYVLAFVFLGVLDFDGPVQGAIRTLFGLPRSWSVEIRHAGGVIVVMTLVLYPYVYMLARVAFLGQGQSTFEAARSLGLSPWQAFRRVSLPMARPAVVAGLSLALMEALADFGAVAVFNFDTFTTAIYKSWFGFFDLHSAAQLASLLLLLVLIALTLERHFRARSRYDETGRGGAQRRFQLTGWRARTASVYAGGVFLLAFAAPVLQLLIWAWRSLDGLDQRYFGLLGHTLTLGVSASLVTVGGAFVLAYTRRNHSDRLTRFSVGVGTLGYALPGSVLAVGVMLSLTWIDNRVADAAEALFGADIGLVLSGTVVALLMAYFARFLAVAFGPVDSALERIRPSMARGRAQPRRAPVGAGAADLPADAAPRPADRGPAGAGRRDEGDARHPAAAPVRLGHARGADLRTDLRGRVGAGGAAGGGAGGGRAGAGDPAGQEVRRKTRLSRAVADLFRDSLGTKNPVGILSKRDRDRRAYVQRAAYSYGTRSGPTYVHGTGSAGIAKRRNAGRICRVPAPGPSTAADSRSARRWRWRGWPGRNESVEPWRHWSDRP